jgi:hypothetical protein
MAFFDALRHIQKVFRDCRSILPDLGTLLETMMVTFGDLINPAKGIQTGGLTHGKKPGVKLLLL